MLEIFTDDKSIGNCKFRLWTRIEDNNEYMIYRHWYISFLFLTGSSAGGENPSSSEALNQFKNQYDREF